MVSEGLFRELNKQITYEFYSCNLYFAMASYCASEDMDGFSNFFRVQAEEEKFHAMKIYDYIHEMGGRVLMEQIDEPNNDYSSILDVFEKGYEHEKFVTSRFYYLTDMAMEEREHATINFLKWFIDEQREEENSFLALVKKLRKIGDNPAGLMLLDNELSQRTFVAPNDGQ